MESPKLPPCSVPLTYQLQPGSSLRPPGPLRTPKTNGSARELKNSLNSSDVNVDPDTVTPLRNNGLTVPV